MSGPISFVRNELRIESRHVGITPGVPKNGEKWRSFGVFQQMSTGVHGHGWDLDKRGSLRTSTALAGA
jgi:hypothetical protein